MDTNNHIESRSYQQQSSARVLQHILARTPDTWDYRNYSTQLYCQILASGSEKNDILRNFPSDMRLRVSYVYRIQNPFLWGRYSLRAEQLQVKGYQVYERTYYHPISPQDKSKVMEYNLDYRRYSSRYDGQYNSSTKKPYLYTDPRTARSSIPALDTVLVVVKALDLTASGNFTKTTKDLDTEYYPAYIVDF